MWMFIITTTPSVNAAISPQNNLSESYSLDISILTLVSLYNSLDFAILDFP